jgi:3-phosphoglycerate kinase
MKNIKDIDLKGKKVLLRTNFDVPVSRGKVTDTSRIRESISTIKYLLRGGAQVYVLTHLGRPVKKDKAYSVRPVAKALEKLLRKKIFLFEEIFDEKISKIDPSDNSKIFMFENIRFWSEEEQNNFNFAKQLASNFDIYVNDAFPVSHRAHATVEAITRYIPSYAGLSLMREVEELSKIKDTPHHPFVVVIGGAKVSDKIGVITNLARKADYILIGGAAANTFLAQKGYKIGASRYDAESLKTVELILRKFSAKIILPIDGVCAASLKARKTHLVDINSIPSPVCSIPYGIYDIGPKTIIKWEDILKTARTVFWSGPLGAFEEASFSKGTKKIARAISQVTSEDHETIVGGGDTIAFLNHFKIKKFTHISTAGSAMLQFVGGEELPALEALERTKK